MKKIIIPFILLILFALGTIKAQTIVANTTNTISWDSNLLKTNGVHFVDQQEGVKYYILVKDNELIGAYAIGQDGNRYDGSMTGYKDKITASEKKKKTKRPAPGYIEICTVKNGIKTCKLLSSTT